MEGFIVPFWFPDKDPTDRKLAAPRNTSVPSSSNAVSVEDPSSPSRTRGRKKKAVDTRTNKTTRFSKKMADSDAPAAKRARQDESGKMNIRHALVKSFEEQRLGNVVDEGVTALEGIGEEREKALAQLGVHTVRDLGSWKYFVYANIPPDIQRNQTLTHSITPLLLPHNNLFFDFTFRSWHISAKLS